MLSLRSLHRSALELACGANDIFAATLATRLIDELDAVRESLRYRHRVLRAGVLTMPNRKIQPRRARPRTRPSQQPTTQPGRGIARARGPNVLTTLKHPDIIALTSDILAKERAASQSDVEARVEIGDRLEELRDRIPHGDWLRWLDSDVPFSARTARSYIALATWARHHPVVFPQLAPLGLSKLYLLLRLPGPELAALLAKSRHRIPTTGKYRSLDGMTSHELAEVVLKRLGAKSNALAAGNRLRRYRSRIDALAGATDELLQHTNEIARDDVVELRDRLREMADQLDEGFDLPPSG